MNLEKSMKNNGLINIFLMQVTASVQMQIDKITQIKPHKMYSKLRKSQILRKIVLQIERFRWDMSMFSFYNILDFYVVPNQWSQKDLKCIDTFKIIQKKSFDRQQRDLWTQN